MSIFFLFIVVYVTVIYLYLSKHVVDLLLFFNVMAIFSYFRAYMITDLTILCCKSSEKVYGYLFSLFIEVMFVYCMRNNLVLYAIHEEDESIFILG